MRNEHHTPEYMKHAIVLLIICLAVLTGCTGKHADGTKDHAEAPPARILSYEEQQGAYLFGKYCAVCHGREGKGDGFNAFNLDPRPQDLSDSTYMSQLSDDQIRQSISGGGRSVNKSPLMPAYGRTLTRQQIQDIAVCVRMFSNQSR